MPKLNATLNRRHFITATGASLGLLVGGCKPKADNLPAADIKPEEETTPKVVSTPVNETVSKPTHAVEELLDIDYTEKEWDQLLTGFDDQIDLLRKTRALNHPNSLAPAQVFDPRLPGVKYNSDNDVFRLAAKSSNLPTNQEDIAFAPATQLSHWIQSKQISSLELTELYLQRIQKHNPTLQCFITVTADLARQQAQQADEEIQSGKYRGPLHGLPYGLKDLFDTKGISTTWGAAPYKENVPESDAHIVKKLRDVGAVLLGKTSCGALAYGDIWYGGVTRNPWDTREGSSGSSAGSASATAAGLVAFSIGTETLGSIVSPSVRCGVTGLRPTFGRVGRSGGMTLCWSLDKIGAICKSVEDTALVLKAINGIDSDDASSIPTEFGYDLGIDLTQLRVGYDPLFFSDQEKHAVNREVLESLKTIGVQLHEITLPARDAEPLMLQLDVEAAAAFEELTLSNRDDELRWQVDKAWPNSFRQARLVPAVDYIQADRLRRLFMQDMHMLFQEVDVIIGDNFGGGMLRITNFTGHPQLTLPCGFSDRKIQTAFEETKVVEGEMGNFPASIGLWGTLFGEGKLLALGHALEEQMNVNSKRPSL
ncbi:MAG: amidase [Verrucomicrobia bacterium]|nr:amidase [Verrucomicrobiota bacterium]MDA1065050.1 amidase [Verrucomicrobiota bacterium]